MASAPLLALLLLLPLAAAAQDADELAKPIQNPVASLISVPLQGNWDFGVGDRETTATLLNIQPVIPFGVSKSTNVILRVIMPLSSQPGRVCQLQPGRRTGDRRQLGGVGELGSDRNLDRASALQLLFNLNTVTLLGKRPVNFSVAARPTIASPAGGASWRPPGGGVPLSPLDARLCAHRDSGRWPEFSTITRMFLALAFSVV